MTSRKCEQCKHFIIAKTGEGKIYGCDRSKCVFEPTTKNNLGVDCISREQAKAAIRDKFKDLPSRVEINTILNELPSVTPQEQQTFTWCTDCQEYDQEKHCCHRWSKVIRNTVEEMKQEQEPKTGHRVSGDLLGGLYCSVCMTYLKDYFKYCPNCGAKMESEVEDDTD